MGQQANGYADASFRPVRAELTDQMLIFGQRHLQRVLAEYVRHYGRYGRWGCRAWSSCWRMTAIKDTFCTSAPHVPSDSG